LFQKCKKKKIVAYPFRERFLNVVTNKT